ncbi:MAG: TonB-dependent receptor [Bacteroidales bacterium]|nr:TonB-dependent receptor [Bacteroidales bacterium]
MKTRFTMRAVAAALVLLFASGFAPKSSAQQQIVTSKYESASMKQVIKDIESQTGLSLMVVGDSGEFGDKQVTGSYDNVPVSDMLSSILGSRWTISFQDSFIIIRKIPESPQSPEDVAEPAADVPETTAMTVSGKVVDMFGQPLVGVFVQKKDTMTGVMTDSDGSFSLEDIQVDDELVFSCLGYASETKTVGGSLLNVTLHEDSLFLDEAVVVAFGQQKKVSITGALASVQNEDIKRSQSSNFVIALAGRLPGLNVQQTTGMPGREDVNITLRGLSTYGDSSPLVLIDGVERDGLSSLDPNEVESVTVLKDAASTAVFGVKGANGVLVVTTRRGEEGKAQLSVSAEQSFQTIAYRYPRLHSWEYAELMNLRNTNSGTAPVYNEWQIEQFRSGSDPVFFPDRDAFKECVKDFAPQTKVNLTASGGTKDAHYFVNASYLHQGGMFNTEQTEGLGYSNDTGYGMDRLNYRANVDYKITKSLTASINLSGYMSKVKIVPYTDGLEWASPDLNHQYITITTMGGIVRCPPTMPGPWVPANSYDNLGKLNEEGGWVAESYQYRVRLNYAGYIHQNLASLNSSAGLNWDLGRWVKGLSMKGMVSFDLDGMGYLKASRWYNAYSFYQAKSADEASYFYQREWNGNSEYLAEDALWFYPNGGRGSSSTWKMNFQGQINYDRLFNEKHDFHAMFITQRDQYVTNGGYYLPYNMIYFSGRAVYTYDNRYTAEVNLGYNGSEQFAKGKRFGFFPAVSAGWVITEEPFMKNSGAKDYVQYIKLRASYGIVGNDKISGSRFLYLDSMTVSDGGTVSSLGRGKHIVEGQVGNQDLTWETARKQNYGLDISFLKDFSLNVDYFREKRDNILITRSTIPQFQGIQQQYLPKANMGKVQNHGVEAILNYHHEFGNDFYLVLSGNFCFTRNKVLEADEVKRATGGKNYLYEYTTTGYPIGQQWGLLVDYDATGNGFINTEEQLSKYARMYDAGGYVPSPMLGSWVYKDLNGDNKIDDKDVAPVGYSSAYPEITYGGTIALRWKGLDFNVLIQGIAHKSGYLCVGGDIAEGVVDGEWVTRSWTKERYEKGETISYRAITNSPLTNNEFNDFVLSDLSFLRLKNVEIGYSLPKKATDAIHMKNLRVSVGCQNALTLSHMKAKVVDPEQSSVGAYPITRNYNLGLQITF